MWEPEDVVFPAAGDRGSDGSSGEELLLACDNYISNKLSKLSNRVSKRCRLMYCTFRALLPL